MMTKRYLVLSTFALLLLAACSAAGAGSTAPELAGSEWLLDDLLGQPLIAGTRISLRFEPETLGGFAGCNAYGGPYSLDADGAFVIVEITSTAEGCVEPEGVLAQESAYHEALRAAQRLLVEGDTLIMRDETGAVVLTFTRRQPSAAHPDQLLGTVWALVAINEQPITSDQPITLAFDGAEYRGYAGCRDYEGEYQAAGDHLTFFSLFMLGEWCDEPSRQTAEMTYISALERVVYYLVSEAQLTLYTVNGGQLLFQALSE